MFSPSFDIHRYGFEGYCPLSAGVLRYSFDCALLEWSDLIRVNANDEVIDFGRTSGAAADSISVVRYSKALLHPFEWNGRPRDTRLYPTAVAVRDRALFPGSRKYTRS